MIAEKLNISRWNVTKPDRIGHSHSVRRPRSAKGPGSPEGAAYAMRRECEVTMSKRQRPAIERKPWPVIERRERPVTSQRAGAAITKRRDRK